MPWHRSKLHTQGFPLPTRLLAIPLWMVGLPAIIRSAMRIDYDRWGVLYASLHVLLTIGLILVIGSLLCGSALNAIVFGRWGKSDRKPPSGVDDRWLD